MRYIGTFRGEGGRAWLLQIVRNTCYSWLSENRRADHTELDETAESWQAVAAPAADEPQAVALRKAEKAQIDEAIAGLPVAFREVLVLRELEDLSYADIARIAEIPIGTVMSRLSRARAMIRESLSAATRPQLRPVPRLTQGGGMS
jgi:RNA polymerase sigma-70 factor (ECF subfamily)